MGVRLEDLPDDEQRVLSLLVQKVSVQDIATQLGLPILDVENILGWLRLTFFLRQDATPQSIVDAARHQGWVND